jgi:serine/threonine-protein kinase
MSPDGRVVVYASFMAGTRQLFRRRLDQLSIDPIPGTEGAFQPFFSPDGRWVAYSTLAGELKKVSIDGGPPVTLAQGFLNGQWVFGDWGADNTMCSAPSST